MTTLVIGLAVGLVIGFAIVGYAWTLSAAWTLADDCCEDE